MSTFKPVSYAMLFGLWCYLMSFNVLANSFEIHTGEHSNKHAQKFTNNHKDSPSLPQKTTNSSKAEVILFGVYPFSLYDFNLADHTFRTGFYAWWRAKDKNYNPYKSIEITNATEYSTNFDARGKNDDGYYYTEVRYYATIHHDWNVKYFPFDRQYLKVDLEDFADTSKVIFEPDTTQSAIHHELKVKGWNLIGMTLDKSITTYDSNFGDISTPKGKFSRLTFTIEIKRQGWRPYFDGFIGFFISAFLCLMLYLIPKSELSDRAGFLVGAIFAFIGNKYILDQNLAFTTDYTLSDVIQAATLVLIVATILRMITLSAFKIPPKNLKIIDRYLGVIFGTLYVLTVCIITYKAVMS